MTQFIRVRYARPGDPLHEFDIPVQTLARHRERYVVVDKKPVAKQRPASHFPGVVAEPAPVREKRAKPRKAASKTGEDTIAPSAGLTPEEEK